MSPGCSKSLSLSNDAHESMLTAASVKWSGLSQELRLRRRGGVKEISSSCRGRYRSRSEVDGYSSAYDTWNARARTSSGVDQILVLHEILFERRNDGAYGLHNDCE